MILKRLLDISVSAAALLLLAPALLAIAIGVRLSSSGPVLFRQSRLGKDGRPFLLFKFRSMFHNSPDLRNPDGSTYSGSQDARVTRIGQFLRKTSLDELPQLFNVFRGDMSLVGPRPDQVDQLKFYSESEKRKLQLKPGITGLAQISGRNQIPWERRKALDIEYVESWSFWLDLRLLARTIPFVLFQKDVYTATDNTARSSTTR
ncbi:MAG TPA: sugar transferase [Bryobacteraceae bacterium]|jgi:lipopolysaccharide/colanic/teichoic acid biosynthesis glycosyltransferase